MKTILVTNGNNDHRDTTKATTKAGYIRAAKKIWPYGGSVSRVKVRVFDDSEGAAGRDPIIFETMIDIY